MQLVAEDDERWRERAACRGGSYRELFWPSTSDTNERGRSYAAAVLVCRSCEVVAECADYARRNGCVGVWGGEMHTGYPGQHRPRVSSLSARASTLS